MTSLLRYCKKEEFSEDDEVKATLTEFYDSAVQYLANADIIRPDAENTADADLTNAGGDKLYDLAVNGMVLFWDDNRGDEDETQGKSMDFPLGVRQIINQLSPISF